MLKLAWHIFKSKKHETFGFVLFKITAENKGFEPLDLLQSIVFKTTAIDHSANSPSAKVKQFLFHARVIYTLLKIIFKVLKMKIIMWSIMKFSVLLYNCIRLYT